MNEKSNQSEICSLESEILPGARQKCRWLGHFSMQFDLVRKIRGRVPLPCAQQESLSCNYTVTLHGLSKQYEFELALPSIAARAIGGAPNSFLFYKLCPRQQDKSALQSYSQNYIL
jgi:hypothetical protein